MKNKMISFGGGGEFHIQNTDLKNEKQDNNLYYVITRTDKSIVKNYTASTKCQINQK
jgi:hypothetical protein